MKPIVITIDSSASENTTVTLTANGKKISKTALSRRVKSQSILPLIEMILKAHNLEISQITHIQVNQGPGSYTGLRVGATIGNTLSQFLNIPINGQKPGSGVTLTYKTYT